MILFDCTLEGVKNLIPHVSVAEDKAVTSVMVTDWLTGFAAYVGLRIGVISVLSDSDQISVARAARRIVERYVAGDVLDVVYQPEVGKEGGVPGEPLRTTARLELEALVVRCEQLRALVTAAVEVDDGGASVSWPRPRVTTTKKW
jgi:hypothetical protein